MSDVLSLTTFAREAGVSVGTLRPILRRLNVQPVGFKRGAPVYARADLERVQFDVRLAGRSSAGEGERDINAQTLRKMGQLQYLLDMGRQEDYERELEYIRNRRRQAQKQRVQREDERSYAEAVDRTEQTVADTAFDED